MRTNEQYRLKGAKIAAKKRQAEMLKEYPTILIVDAKKWDVKNEKISLDGHEWVAKFACTLIGFLDGKYFGCSLISLDNIPEDKKDMVDLFFNETEKQSNLPNSPQMSTSRAKEFSDKLCKQLNEAGYAEISTVLNKLHAVWEKRQLDAPIKIQQSTSLFSLKPIEKKPLSMSEILISEKPKPISKAAQEALAAKQLREENERKTQERKMQKVVQKAKEKMLHSFSNKQEMDFIYNRNDKDNLCLYGKIKGEAIYINMDTTEPKCYAVTPNQARPLLNTEELYEIYGKIIENLSHDSSFESNLNNIGIVYHNFLEKQKRYGEMESNKINKLYQDICEQLMTPRVVQSHSKRKTNQLARTVALQKN